MSKEIYGDPDAIDSSGMEPGELRTLRIKEYQLKLIARAIELKVGRPLPGGAGDVSEN